MDHSMTPMRFGMYEVSRRSKSASMVDSIDSCTALCIAILIVTLAITYHVHDLANIEKAKDANSTTAKRLHNIRMALFILILLEIACLYVKMM